MKKIVILFTCVVLIFTAGVSATSIYSLIMEGDLESATDSLSSYSTASLRDGNLLFCAGLLQSDAEESVRLLEAALNVSIAAVFREQIYHRLAQYYFIKGNYDKLLQIVTDYSAMWETGRYGKEMLRYSIMIDELQDNYESALRQTDRCFLLYGDGEDAHWCKIDKARVLLHNQKRIGAGNILRKLSREKTGPGGAQALYLLTLDAIDQGRTDDAVLYYNLLRESFPSAVGLDALVERMTSLSTSEAHDNTAEKLTGTFYSIQVGVFKIEANSWKQKSLFEDYGKQVDTKFKIISNVKYYVVYVGHFSDYESAVHFKRKLEADHNEVFQVVAR